MTPMKKSLPFLTVLTLTPILLSACVVTRGEYRTIVLDEGFELRASKIEVKAPVRRYKAKFYNVPLGEYQSTNVAIEKTVSTRASETEQEPIRRKTVDNTFWNLILNQEFNIEKVTYDQYRIEDQGGFSYAIAQSNGPSINSTCVTNSVFLENSEVSRTQIGLSGNDKASKVEYYGDWLASRLICTINDADQSWTLEYYKTAEGTPKLSITRPGSALNVVAVAESSTNSISTAGRTPTVPAAAIVGDKIPGISIQNDTQQLAAVSLVEGNNVIWLSPDLSNNDRLMLVAASYGLILDSWLTL